MMHIVSSERPRTLINVLTRSLTKDALVGGRRDVRLYCCLNWHDQIHSGYIPTSGIALQREPSDWVSNNLQDDVGLHDGLFDPGCSCTVLLDYHQRTVCSHFALIYRSTH